MRDRRPKYGRRVPRRNSRAGTSAHRSGLAPRLDPRRFTLQAIGDAYQSIKDGSAQGKLVVDIVPPAVRGTN
jgi:hypothetical protein